MAKFLKTTDIRSAVDSIIREADNQVTLISPFVRISLPLFQSLKIADSRKVGIRLVYGKKKELDPDVRRQLEQLDNLQLFFLENLHAKCFFNEKIMVVTSLNLYDFSEQNVEMGILISEKDDTTLFSDVTKEAKSVCTLAEKVQLKSSVVEKVVKEIAKVGKLVSDTVTEDEIPGHCIRCGTAKEYNTNEPFCPTHYRVWNRYRDDNFPEKFCHRCGKEAVTSKARPLCDSCYHKFKD